MSAKRNTTPVATTANTRPATVWAIAWRSSRWRDCPARGCGGGVVSNVSAATAGLRGGSSAGGVKP